MSLLVADAGCLITMAGHGPLRGAGMNAPEVMAGGSVLCDGDRFVAPGTTRPEVEFDASGCTVVPGFVDPHTHIPFYGWRADEDSARLSGVRYETLHQDEGGIFRSRRLLAEASDEDVLSFGQRLTEEMLRSGTTTFEMKSGYGLSVDAELRQLRLAAGLADLIPQKVVSTCLAAHAVPDGKTQGGWVGEVSDILLPQVVAEGLASACDIYIETIAFALEHAARLSTAAQDMGLTMRVHADQLADNQTASFATRWGFRSADHLNHTSREGVGDLAGSDTAAVLLPGATFTLRQSKKPPVEDLVKSGAIVALGSDLNPGTSPIHSMPFVIALACRLYGMRPLEALAAATVNSAWVLGLDDEVGRIQDGHRADLVVLDMPSPDHLAYRPDHDHVLAVACAGELVYIAEGAERRVTSSKSRPGVLEGR